MSTIVSRTVAILMSLLDNSSFCRLRRWICCCHVASSVSSSPAITETGSASTGAEIRVEWALEEKRTITMVYI